MNRHKLKKSDVEYVREKVFMRKCNILSLNFTCDKQKMLITFKAIEFGEYNILIGEKYNFNTSVPITIYYLYI